MRSVSPHIHIRMFDTVRTLAHRAARSLVRSRTYAAGVVFVLAIGVGATTVLFAIVDAALLRPLPYPDDQRLVAIEQTRNDEAISVSYLDLLDIRRMQRTMTDVAAFAGQSLTISGDGEAERVRGMMVTANLFATLGVRPLVGREFTAAEDEPNGPPVVAMSYALWQRRFGGARDIVGRVVRLDGRPVTVVAVMPDGFRFPDGVVYGAADLWTPMSALDGPDRTNRDAHPGLVALGRMRPGATLAQARAELSAIGRRLAAEYPDAHREAGVRATSAREMIVGDVRRTLVLLLGASALVLAIALINVAGLALARADARQREVVVRAALGARGWQLGASLAAEGVLLSTIGGVVGVGSGWLALRLLAPTLADLPRLDALGTSGLDWRVAGFAVGATMLVAVCGALVPVHRTRGADAQLWLRARSGIGGRHASRSRDLLVAGEVALAVMLIASAALLLRTFARLQSDTGGIAPDGRLTFALRVPSARYDDDGAIAFHQLLDARLRAIPGVRGVGAISVLPFSGAGAQSGIGPTNAGRDAERRTDVHVVTRDYFRAMGVALRAGRGFTVADGPSAPPVAVIDETLASTLWPGRSAIGMHVSGWGAPDREVVGVVAHVKSYGVAAESRGELYVPIEQRANRQMTYVLRVASGADPSALAPSVRRAVASLDPEIAIYNVRTMRAVVNTTVAGPRLAAAVTGAFSTASLTLAAAGLFALMSFLVGQRTRELGVQMALGATRRRVLGVVMRQGLRVASVGLVAGIVGAAICAPLLRGMLFGVGALDLGAFTLSAVVVLMAASVATLGPALRAMRLSPMAALRDE